MNAQLQEFKDNLEMMRQYKMSVANYESSVDHVKLIQRINKLKINSNNSDGNENWDFNL